MKKTLGFILLIISIFMFSSCSVKINTPEVPKTFTQNAVVTSGDFSYECEICKKEGSVSITVKNTNALGLVMTYDGKNVSFKYSTYSYDISGENFEKENAAIIIYDVISALSNDDTKLHIIDGGVKYEGKTNFGEFILVQNDNSTLKSLAFKNSDFKIVFKKKNNPICYSQIGFNFFRNVFLVFKAVHWSRNFAAAVNKLRRRFSIYFHNRAAS